MPTSNSDPDSMPIVDDRSPSPPLTIPVTSSQLQKITSEQTFYLVDYTEEHQVGDSSPMPTQDSKTLFQSYDAARRRAMEIAHEKLNVHMDLEFEEFEEYGDMTESTHITVKVDVRPLGDESLRVSISWDTGNKALASVIVRKVNVQMLG